MPSSRQWQLDRLRTLAPDDEPEDAAMLLGVVLRNDVSFELALRNDSPRVGHQLRDLRHLRGDLLAEPLEEVFGLLVREAISDAVGVEERRHPHVLTVPGLSDRRRIHKDPVDVDVGVQPVAKLQTALGFVHDSSVG